MVRRTRRQLPRCLVSRVTPTRHTGCIGSSDSRVELRPLVRAEVPPSNAAVVLRGGPDSLSLLSVHARRLHRLYVLDGEPLLGVSVFVAHDDVGPASERNILMSKLRSYPLIYRTTVRVLTDRGFSLLPTFSDPHYTVVLRRLDAVTDLALAFGKLVANPYAEGRKEER